jgi:exonuclease III
MINLLTWNVAGRTVLLADQAAAVARREPDIVALQEVRPSTAALWREALAAAGLESAADSGRHRDGRRLFNLTASRFGLYELSPLASPRPERVLSVLAETPAGEIEIHNAHIPPAPSNGLIKVEACEALYGRLGRPSIRRRILCGDLNTPRSESVDGEIETFALNHPENAARWDAAERSIVEGLAAWDLHDCFRALHGYERQDSSWVMHTRSRRKAAFRLDHVLASAELNVVHCDYIHEWREAGFSDHSAMEAVFDPA